MRAHQPDRGRADNQTERTTNARIGEDRTLKDTCDLVIVTAEQVNDFDCIAITAERVARRKPYRRSTGECEKQNQAQRHPAKGRKRRQNRCKPLPLRIDMSTRSGFPKRRTQAIERCLVRRILHAQIDQRRNGHRIFGIVAAEPGFEKVFDRFPRYDFESLD